jgi:hypothetical protein
VSKSKPKRKLTPPPPGEATLTGHDLADAQAVLSLAVCNAVDALAACTLDEHGDGPPEGGIWNDLQITLRAGIAAAHIGGPGDPVPMWFVLSNDRRAAVREIVSRWARWCRSEARDHAAGMVLDGPTPPEVVPYWTKQAETAERVVEAIDAGRWGPTEEEVTA